MLEKAAKLIGPEPTAIQADVAMKSTRSHPAWVFQDIGEIEAHHDIVRVHWAMIDSAISNGLTGDDFIKIKTGKVSEVYIIVNGWTKSSGP